MMKTTLPAIALAALLAFTASGARAHGDEDHGTPPAPSQPPAGAPLTGSGAPQRLADGSLFVPKPVQRQLGLRTLAAEIGELAASVEFNGRVIADPNAGGRVQATQSGRVEPGPQGMPTLGQRVAKGQVLAWLRPVASSIERGNQQSQLAELESQLAIAKRKAERYDQLEGAVPQKEIESAHIELASLKQRRTAVGASIHGAEALVAPVAGVIGAAGVVAGQVVEAKDILFEVIDPARLAVEALAYDPAQAEGLTAASAVLPGGSLALEFVGGGRQLREQALPLLFRVKAAAAPVAVGQPVKVIARTARRTRGAAIPQGAVVKNGSGEAVVWLHTEAERFVPRRVQVQPLDGETAAVIDGLKGGERVVSEGAALLAQVR